MRTALERRNEFAPDHSQPDRELTLSSTTLLAIFFGLVLVCGLFFGLGYTLGRRSPAEPTTELQRVQNTTTASTIPPSVTQPKPSAASQAPVVAPPVSTPLTDETLSETKSETRSKSEESDSATLQSATLQRAPLQNTSVEAKPVVRPAIKTPESAATEIKPAIQPAIASTQRLPVETASGVMVQIAAVTNPADADVLVRALQKHGYSATIHRDASDSFLHVQLGPFANRDEAVIIRQKLLNDGYNAILK